MSEPPRSKAGLLAAVLAVAAVLAFGRSVTCGWIWDDDDYVTGNVLLKTPGGLADIWLSPRSLPQWYPVVHTTFWAEVRLWGFEPAGFHAVNVLLHALNAVLLWRVLLRLGVPGAWIGALLFAVHPVHAESVAWVTERKNVLSGAFYLGSLLAWIRWSGLGGDGDPAPAGRRTWALSFFLFVAALLSKSVTATLPALALVLVWWKRGSITKRDILPLVPFFVAGIGLGLHTAYLEREHVGAEGADWALGPADRVVLAGQALWYYASKLVAPRNLTFIYPRWPVDAGVPWQWTFTAAVLGTFAALGALRDRVGRGPLAAALAFAGTLFPALGFLNVYPFRYSWVADHFQYLASAALLALGGAGLARASAALEPRAGPAARWLAAPVVAALAVASFLQCAMYRDLESLWRTTVERNPSAWMAYNNLAVVEIKNGRYREAEALVRASLLINPNHHEGWNNLGSCRSGFKDYEGAEAAYRKAVALVPEFSMAWTNLGEVLEARKRPDEALEAFRRGASFERTWRGAHEALVRALLDRGRPGEAGAEAREAMRRFPRDVSLLVRLGAALSGAGASREATAILEEAARRDPGNAAARIELGRARFGAGDAAGAAADLREAVRLDPESVEARVNLGTVLRSAGDLAGAESAWREAVRRDPGNDAALAGLGRIAVQAGRLEEAEARFAEAAARRPDSWQVRHGRASLRIAQGRLREAAEDLRDVVAVMPDFAPALRDLARLLSVGPDPAVQAPEAAVVVAERLVGISRRKDAAHLDVLAAALAAAGRFGDAVAAAEEALRLDPPEPLRSTLRAHLESFRAGKPLAE